MVCVIDNVDAMVMEFLTFCVSCLLSVTNRKILISISDIYDFE